MFIQGDLQALFDALYEVGAIDPVLKMDWSQVTSEMARNQNILTDTVRLINSCSGDRELLVQKLKFMDGKSLNYLAMEVAREFAEFQDRKELH
ncbi:MAG: cytochrome [Bdellovibrio sp. CG10_big_fil_rev_8_21_14_0_10_47_8]|nr:MAG: cytochrome [Bdellovibrio sp. CG10_big_fil_rev_8_21_14_0_10_47_8]